MKLLALHNVHTHKDTDVLWPVEGPFGVAIYAVPYPADDATKDALVKAMWQYIKDQDYEGVILEWDSPATPCGQFVLIFEPVPAEYWDKIISFHEEHILLEVPKGVRYV